LTVTLVLYCSLLFLNPFKKILDTQLHHCSHRPQGPNGVGALHLPYSKKNSTTYSFLILASLARRALLGQQYSGYGLPVGYASALVVIAAAAAAFAAALHLWTIPIVASTISMIQCFAKRHRR